MLAPRLPALIGAIAGLIVCAVAQAQRPTAPVGYLVAYTRSDGKAFDDGKSYRIYGVTKNFRTRSDWVNEINSYHRFKATVIELKNDAEYEAAVKLLNDSKKPDGQRPTAPAAASVANTVWRMSAEDNIWFYADGAFEIGRSRRLASNDNGTWTQNGNTVTLRSSRLGSETWTVNGSQMTYGLRKATLLK